MLIPILVQNLGTTAPPVGAGIAHFEVSECGRDRPLAGAIISIDGVVYGSTSAIGTLDLLVSAGAHSYSIAHDPIIFTGSYPVFAQSRLATLQSATGNFVVNSGGTVEVLVCLEFITPAPGLRLWNSRLSKGWISQINPLE
jgi:hypothetical protein